MERKMLNVLSESVLKKVKCQTSSHVYIVLRQEGRTALHYAALCRDEAGAAALLEGAGAVRGARDASGRAPNHYRGAARTLLALPTALDMAPPQDKSNGKCIHLTNCTTTMLQE